MGWFDSFTGGISDAGNGLMGNIGGGITDPLGNIGNMAGFQDPNSTGVGKNLSAMKGALTTYGDVAAAAKEGLGTNYYAPTVARRNEMKANVATADPFKMNAAQMTGAQAADAPQMSGAQLNLSQSDQAREQQNQLVSGLQQTAAGRGPSVAQEQLRQGTAANINQQASAAQAAHGAARLAAMRSAGQNQAQIQQQANSQAAALRAQEIAAAQGNLGNALTSMRGQDVGAAGQNAQLLQQTGATNLGSSLQTNMLNAQLGQQTGMQNALLAQQAAAANQNALNQNAQFNAGAYNTSSNNWAAQVNSGDLSRDLANLQASLGTNQLNTQRQLGLTNALMGVAGGQTAIDTTMYHGTEDYNAQKRQMIGQGINKISEAGQANSMGGMGSLMGGGGGGLGMLAAA